MTDYQTLDVASALLKRSLPDENNCSKVPVLQCLTLDESNSFGIPAPHRRHFRSIRLGFFVLHR